MSIRRRLSLLVVVLAVPAALLAGFLAYTGYRHERSAVELRLQDTARALALAVDRQLGQAEATARDIHTRFSE